MCDFCGKQVVNVVFNHDFYCFGCWREKKTEMQQRAQCFENGGELQAELVESARVVG